MTTEKDYVLGTHDDEIERLGLQHRVWRPRVTDAWQRAGFTVGQTLLDVGCGPGYATLDLAEIVGPTGRVVGVDRSRRFLSHLEAEIEQRGIGHVETVEMDLDDAGLVELLPAGMDGAWCRWVYAFVQDPKALLARVAGALRPLIAGSDSPVEIRGDTALMPFGKSLHRELRSLVRAGLTPLEALRAATVNAARHVGVGDSLGVIRAGMPADFVVVDANPLVDIGNLERIHAVGTRGRYFARPALDSLIRR
ncbi:MAG: methyltransferase domain-containing protein [Gemmatimonadaceae bacterium]